jgi:hypothetical protein
MDDGRVARLPRGFHIFTPAKHGIDFLILERPHTTLAFVPQRCAQAGLEGAVLAGTGQSIGNAGSKLIRRYLECRVALLPR